MTNAPEQDPIQLLTDKDLQHGISGRRYAVECPAWDERLPGVAMKGFDAPQPAVNGFFHFGAVKAYGGSTITLALGFMEELYDFSRDTGECIEGPSTGFQHARIMESELVLLNRLLLESGRRMKPSEAKDTAPPTSCGHRR